MHSHTQCHTVLVNDFMLYTHNSTRCDTVFNTQGSVVVIMTSHSLQVIQDQDHTQSRAGQAKAPLHYHVLTAG